MKLYFANYADENYYGIQQRLNAYAKGSLQFEDVFEYKRDWLLTTKFYEKNKKILNLQRGGGYCLWKPYILLESFKKMRKNDILFYLDSADWFTGDIRKYLLSYMKNNEILLTKGGYTQSDWTKKDTFYLMGCDYPEYRDSTQLEAGIIALKKNNTIEVFLKEWLSYCENENILTEVPNIYGDNYDGFKEHRYDQSVLTNLQIKYNLPQNLDIREYCQCNVNMP